MNPQDRDYTQEHEWVQQADGVATIGLTEYARKALGEVVFIDLPAVGQEVDRSQPVGEVESTKSVTDIYAPMPGTVIETNDHLVKNPFIINNDPWEEGWLMRIRIDKNQEPAVLMDADTYTSITQG